jgi:hypothetical protein
VLPTTEMVREDERRVRFCTEAPLRVTESTGLDETGSAVPRQKARPTRRTCSTGCPFGKASRTIATCHRLILSSAPLIHSRLVERNASIYSWRSYPHIEGSLA